jgi:NADPH:quinone reductase-like Zn-dependent oxidoreductase
VLPEIHTFPVYGLIVSRSNHNLIKHYEADYIFNYRTEDVASQIKAAAPDLTYVFSTIGSPRLLCHSKQRREEKGQALYCAPRQGEHREGGKRRRGLECIVWTAFLSEHRNGDFHWPVSSNCRMDSFR